MLELCKKIQKPSEKRIDGGYMEQEAELSTCAICSKELYTYQGHEDVTPEDFICTVRISDDPDRKMDYIVRSLVTAMVRGGVYFLDGIAKIRSRALAPLESLLDERRYIDSDILGERIDAHPGFRFIAATNPSDMEVNQLPDFIIDRMDPVIPFGCPNREEIDRIVHRRYRILGENGTLLVDQFWKLWREKNGAKPPTPRDSIDIFGYALKLANYKTVKHTRPLILETDGSPLPIKEEDLEKAFDIFFKKQERSQQCRLCR